MKNVSGILLRMLVLFFQGIVLCLFAFLVYSFIRSGLLYELDTDEITAVHTAYLIAHGSVPHIDFYSIYPQLFQWILLPFVKLSGFTFSAFTNARYVMLGLFFIRLYASIWLVRQITNRTIMYLFVLLLFLDVFNAFTFLQIRPDNLMMTVFTVSMALAVYAVRKPSQSHAWMLLSGGTLALTVLVLAKAVPFVAVWGMGIIFYLLSKKQFQQIVVYVLGAISVVLGYILLHIVQGNFIPMAGQVFQDSVTVIQALKYPLPPGNFYWPNGVLFGFAGRPLTFVFVWLLPMLAAIGVYVSLTKRLYYTKNYVNRYITVTLAVMMIVLWVSLFIIYTIFIQYYIPLTWLYALFAAICLEDVWQRITNSLQFRIPAMMLLFCASIPFIWITYQANMNRSKISYASQRSYIEHIWSVIPEKALTYPNYIFRPNAYPLIYNYNYFEIPDSILNRFGPIETYLQSQKVPYLWLDSTYLQNLPPQTRKYIQDTYHIVDAQYWIWKRNE